MNTFLQIAIDGPVGAGKSTVAKAVAERLGILYVDTGAMYRAVALYAKRADVDWHDEEGVVPLLSDIHIRLVTPSGAKKDGRHVTVLLGDEDVSWAIRRDDMGEGASVVSQYPQVRAFLVEQQQEMARNSKVIMEGRDIGTRVLPQADLKIYMDADVSERVRRKQKQLRELGVPANASSVRKDVVTRDTREMTRTVDPLRPAPDAWILDTSQLSVKQVVDTIVARVASL